MVGIVRYLEFSEGVTVSGPSEISSSASKIGAYADVAAYQAANGTPEDGSIFLNTTTKRINVYATGAWHSKITHEDVAYNVNTTLSNGSAIGDYIGSGYPVYNLRMDGDGGAVSLSSTLMNHPSGMDVIPTRSCTIRIIGKSDTNTIYVYHNDAPQGAKLRGHALLKKDYILELLFVSGMDRLVEVSRNF